MPKSKGKSKFYAVAVGRQVGVFSTWNECETQVKGYKGAIFKSFKTKPEADTFAQQQPQAGNDSSKNKRSASSLESAPPQPPQVKRYKETKPSKNPFHLPDDDDDDDDDNMLIQQEGRYIEMSFDGGSRGNPGRVAGCGAEVVIRYVCTQRRTTEEAGSKTKIIRTTTRIRQYLKEADKKRNTITNNQAEYFGLIAGLEHVYSQLVGWDHQSLSAAAPGHNEHDHKQTPPLVRQFHIQGDSNLIIQQMKGNYAAKTLDRYYKLAKQWMKKIETAAGGFLTNNPPTFQHVYRNDNKIADALANEAMDAERSWYVFKDADGTEQRVDLEDSCPITYQVKPGSGGTKNSAMKGRRVRVMEKTVGTTYYEV